MLQGRYFLLINCWHAANCLNPFIGGKGDEVFSNQSFWHMGAVAALEPVAGKEEPTDNGDSCCPASNHWSHHLTPNSSENQALPPTSRMSLIVCVSVPFLFLQVLILRNICCNIAAPPRIK